MRASACVCACLHAYAFVCALDGTQSVSCLVPCVIIHHLVALSAVRYEMARVSNRS